MKYTLYHIKGVKWGMTCNLNKRLSAQGYTKNDCCEFEYYNDVDIAADREKELNVKFGYPWSDAQDWRRVYKMVKDTHSFRAQIGEKNPRSKLKAEDVLSIRNKYIPFKYTIKMLANEYSVSNDTIKDILDFTSWKHL